jgi:RNA polymerase sigma factor (sigma-70 family)
MTDDAELLRRYAEKRAEAAFAEFVQRHIGLVYAAARRRLGGDAHGAADVAQVVFVAAAREASALARHASVTGWLYTTTRNAALNHMREEHRRKQRERDAFTAGELLVEASPRSEWERLTPVLDAAMDELEDDDREAVLLRYFEGRGFAEIGRRVRLSENAARMRVDRALDKLHALLARRGVTSTAAALGVVLANQAGAGAAAVPAGLAGSVTSAAMAGAVAGVVAPVVGVLGFMSTAKLAVGVATMFGVAGLGTALYESRQVERAEATTAGMRREVEALRARVAQAELRAQEAEKQSQAGEARIVALRKEAEAAPSRQNAGRPASTATAKDRPAPAGANPGMEMLGNPEYMRLQVQANNALFGLRFKALYNSLRLTPEQIARFETNRAAFHQATMEVWSAAIQQGVAVGDRGVTELARKSAGTLDKELYDLLGADGHSVYLKYSNASSGLELVTTLAGHVSLSGVPLSAQQGERLVQTVIDNTLRVPSASGANVMRYETNLAAVESGSAQILSESQMDVFRRLLVNKRLQQEMGALSSAARAAGSRPTSGGTTSPADPKPGR